MEAVFTMNESRFRGVTLFAEPMAKHTSWRAGGKANRFVSPKDVDDLANLLRSLPEEEKIMWLGLGSNTLFRDGGYRGTVIAMQNVTTQMELQENNVVHVGAGVTCAKFARFCARSNLGGAEFFAGIPGLMGGALAMNAGAFGGETWKNVMSVETMDRYGNTHLRDNKDFSIGYRSAQGIEGEWFISATMKFETGISEETTKKIKRLLSDRSRLQPTGFASCGSVFMNPDDDYAARLIEDSNLKGYRIGGAVVSEKHANFIINDKNATATDIEDLIEHIQREVFEKHNVKLSREVHIVGEKIE